MLPHSIGGREISTYQVLICIPGSSPQVLGLYEHVPSVGFVGCTVLGRLCDPALDTIPLVDVERFKDTFVEDDEREGEEET